MSTCGSLTLMKDGEDAVCKKCGYVIKNYKKLRLEIGDKEFNKFERNMS